jgi:aminopeptidase N
MIRTLLGPDGFRAGMDRYFDKHDGEAATVEDFVRCFEEVSGRDLSQFMTWYAQAGTPGLVCDLKWDPRKQTADLTVEQVLPPTPGQPKKKPLHVPIKLGLLGGNGNDLPLQLAKGEAIENGVLELRKRKETFRFVNVPVRPVPSLLREFSAPVNLTITMSDGDLAYLMANDSDAFNRWQATQDYAGRLLVAGVAAKAAGKPLPSTSAFIDALGAIIADERLEPAFRALVLTLPGEAEVARLIGANIDPAAIHKVRAQLRRRVAVKLGDLLERLYLEHAVREAYAPSPEQIGKRSLRNAALSLLAARGGDAEAERARKHFAGARNLTDESAGLAVLADMKGAPRAEAFDRFFERWKHDHLVIDMWFAHQASSSLPDTLQVVRKLLRHPLMSLQNPNKARTLVGVFASNAVQFNRPDGKGYAFVADCILEIDRFNPQLAARLLTSFRSWRTLEPERRKLSGEALERIKRATPLSRDVYEIVTRMLE